MPVRLRQLSKSGVGRKNKSTTETTWFLPTDTKYVVKSECKRKQMADGEEWEETRRAPWSSPLGPPPSLLHPFTPLHYGAKKIKGEKRVCVRACAHVCVRLSPKEVVYSFCIIYPSFHLNSSIFSPLFNVLPVVILSWGEEHSTVISYGYTLRLVIINTCVSSVRNSRGDWGQEMTHRNELCLSSSVSSPLF